MGPLKNIRFFVESLMLRLGLLVIPGLHRRIIRLLAPVAGHVAYACSRKQRRITLANLDIAFGDTLSKEDRQKIARQSFCTTALVMLDLLWFSRHTKVRMSKYVSVDPSVKTRLEMSPVIGVTAHFGNWELISMATAEMGVEHAAVVADLKNPYVNPFLDRLRNTTGVKAVRKQGAIRGLLKALRNRKSIALLLDQNTIPRDGGIFVKFFDLPAPVSSAAGVLSERTGTPVLAIFCMLRADGTYYLYSLPDMQPPAGPAQRGAGGPARNATHSVAGGPVRSDARSQPSLEAGGRPAGNAVTEMTEAIVRAFESEIGKHPEQWLWMYKRWKYIAPGMPREAYPFYSRSVPNT